MDDTALLAAIEGPRKASSARFNTLKTHFEYITKELKCPGVTLDRLWQEYRTQHPDGYGYSQFCFHYQTWRNTTELTMHLDYKAGDKMFVDFTGNKLFIVDKNTGAACEVEVFVAVLAASHYTYVEATASQKKPHWINANQNAFHYFGGVPKAVVPDCLKSTINTKSLTLHPKGCCNMAKNGLIKQAEICKVEATSQKICGRGGLFFFLRYVENTGFYALLEKHFGFLKDASKGLSLSQFSKQLFAHFVDGTDMAMTVFDRRQTDMAYAAVLENVPSEMASSHQMKRFFRKFLAVPNWLYRQILLAMFLWRLRIEQPKIIVLVGDSMVLDNDDAEKREGVGPTYKNKKGYHPLHITWGPYVIDAIFRNG